MMMTMRKPLTATTKIKTERTRRRLAVRGHAVVVAPGIEVTADDIGDHLGLDHALQGLAEAAQDPALRDQLRVAQGLVPPREAGRGVLLGPGADRGIVQDRLDGRGNQGRLAREVGPGLVPVLVTVTEIRAGGRDRGVDHMIDHVIVEGRGPGRGHMREGGATVPVLVLEIVTGEV